MNKNFWATIFYQDRDGREYSYARKIPSNTNLVNYCTGDTDIKIINLCATKKEACALAQYWNDQSMAKGVYAWA